MKMNIDNHSFQEGFSPVFIIVGVVALIGLGLLVVNFSTSSNSILGNLKKTPATNQQTSNQTSKQETTQAESNLKSIFSSIENTYNGNIPWANVNKKLAFQFFTKEMKGLTLPYITTNRDNNYNPLTVFKLTESVSIPLKNSYVSYYEVPDVLRDNFKLGESEIALPIELKVYEFDRQLNEKEKSIIVTGENFRCTNDKSKTETTSFTNQQIAIYYCNVNLTSEQKTQVAKKGFFDKIYEVYFIDRNLLIQFSVDSEYIDNHQDYLSDYLSKIFNSNDTLLINQNQIQSVEKAREFEEWRSRTFDKK